MQNSPEHDENKEIRGYVKVEKDIASFISFSFFSNLKHMYLAMLHFDKFFQRESEFEDSGTKGSHPNYGICKYLHNAKPKFEIFVLQIPL